MDALDRERARRKIILLARAAIALVGWAGACQPQVRPPPHQQVNPKLTTGEAHGVTSASASASARTEGASEPVAPAPLAGELTIARPEVAEVLGSRTSLVRRRCFTPLFVRQPGLAAKGVRVSCSVDVSPEGAVTRAEAVNEAYPELAACVEELLRSLRFPRSEQGGSLAFPFIGISSG